MRRRAPLILVTAAAGTLLAACGGDSPTEPAEHGPAVRVVAGGGVSDTVHGRPVQALIVEVRDSLGRLMPNAIVRFEANRPTAAGRTFERAIYVCPVGLAVCGNDPMQIDGGGVVAVDTTDASGRVLASIRLGTVAGPASVAVSVPELGLSTTASYTVQPGAADHIALAADDTAIVVGAPAALSARVLDAYGNVRPEAPAVTATPDLQVSGATVSAGDIADGWVVARFGTMVDSMRVRVVPAGRLAVWLPQHGTVTLTNLDGTDARTVLSSIGSDFGVFPRFGASGTRVTAQRGAFGWGGAATGFVSIDTMGGGRVDVTPAGLTQITQVRELEDGAYLFVARPVSAAGEPRRPASLWRRAADGTLTAVVEIPDYPESAISGYGGADLSRDGTRLAYVVSAATFDSPSPLRVLNVATGAVTTIAPNARSPRWAPAGDRIAYLRPPDAFPGRIGGHLHVATADGSTSHPLGAGTMSPGLAWSPDGRYVVGRSDGEGKLRVLHVDNGREVTLRLGETVGVDYRAFIERDYFQPDWR